MRKRGFLSLLPVVLCWLSSGVARAGAEASPETNLPLPLIPQAPSGTQATPAIPQAELPASLHDIYGPVQLPVMHGPFFWPLIALLVVVAGALLFLGVVFWRRRRKAGKPAEAAALALAALDELRGLMTPSQSLVYATRLSEILRGYIESRFQIHSTRQTTKEFFAALTARTPAAPELAEYQSRLGRCLDQCDLAKFARYAPDIAEMELMGQAVREFIQTTELDSSRQADQGGP